MKKLIVVLLAVLGGYYASGRAAFSESHVGKWLDDSNARSISRPQEACDDFTSDVVFEINGTGPKGPYSMKGGKAEICRLITVSAAVMQANREQVSSHVDIVSVKRDGFPWLTATVVYRETSQITMRDEDQSTVSMDTVVLRRTFKGLRAQRLTSNTQSI